MCRSDWIGESNCVITLTFKHNNIIEFIYSFRASFTQGLFSMFECCHFPHDIFFFKISYSFQNLGIQCVRRREVKEAIIQRITRGINPFNGECSEFLYCGSITTSRVSVIYVWEIFFRQKWKKKLNKKKLVDMLYLLIYIFIIETQMCIKPQLKILTQTVQFPSK